MQIPSIRLSPRARRALAMTLGAVAFAADALHAVASRFRAPRTIDAIALDHADRCRDVCEGSAWIPSARVLTTPPWEA